MKESTPTVQRHEEIILSLKERLKNAGVPDNAIVEEWGIKNKYIADLAILSQEYNIPISIFEIKVFPKIGNPLLDSVVGRFKRLVYSLKTTVSCYLVVAERETDEIEIFNLSDAVYNNTSLSTDDLPALKCERFDFLAMQNGTFAKLNATINQKNDEKRDLLKNLCHWWIPFFFLIILYLDFKNYYPITTERLWIYGGLVVIRLLPLCEKFSFGPVNITPRNREDKQND